MRMLYVSGKCVVLPRVELPIKKKTAFLETIASSITMRKTALVSRSARSFSGIRGDLSIIYANYIFPLRTWTRSRLSEPSNDLLMCKWAVLCFKDNVMRDILKLLYMHI